MVGQAAKEQVVTLVPAPTRTGGEHAERAITSGAADLCAVGRPLFAHPDWPYIVRAGEPYNWTEFDRKYVVKPSYDYACGYPLNRAAPDWDPDFSKRRPT